jgi:hypothetical protein
VDNINSLCSALCKSRIVICVDVLKQHRGKVATTRDHLTFLIKSSVILPIVIVFKRLAHSDGNKETSAERVQRRQIHTALHSGHGLYKKKSANYGNNVCSDMSRNFYFGAVFY